MHFPGLEKSLILGKMAEVWKRRGVSFFGPNISCCLKTGSILSVIEQFSISHGKFKLVIEE